MVQSKKGKSGTKQKTESGSKKASSPSSADPVPVVGDHHAAANDNIFNEVEDYAVFLLDTSGKILSWNKGAEKIKGYEAHEIIGKNYNIFYTTEDKERNLSETLLEQARQQGRTSYEGWRVRKDGTRFWGSLTLTALHAKDGLLRGFLKMTRDLTDKKIAEDSHSNFVEELRIANEQLKKSEERYHKMIEEVRDYAIILLDKDGYVLEWNKGAERLKGYKPSEIIGKSFRMFYPKEDKQANVPEQLLKEAVNAGSVVNEGWRIRKDGTRFWANVTITALHGDNGEIIGFSKVTRDLTEMKVKEDRFNVVLEELRQTNEQLRDSEERYHRMIAEVQDYAIILLDRQGLIQNWNAGAEVIKGYTAREVIGKSFRIFYTTEDRKRNLPEALLQQAVLEGKASFEGWRVRKDGTRFWGSIVITALHNAQGELIGFSKVTRDLTERKNVEDLLRLHAAQLDLKNKTLERLNEELSSFTYVASHDLKEPLRKIQTYAARIESSGYDETRSREFLEKVKVAAAGMQELINDLLSYSQVSHEVSAEFERVDLNKTLKSVFADLEILIQEKQATFDCGTLPVVRGIPHQLQQIFQNLISNALKFSKPDVPPHVEIESEVIHGPDLPNGLSNGDIKYHHITVTDNGIGFPQDTAGKIFEPFQRLHSKSVFAGSGVGLAIVKKIIDNHNGIIAAEGNPGVGAVFHLYLPL